MMKIVGFRGSGKTESLIEIANTTKYVLVEPNFRMADNVKARVKQKGCEIRVITSTEFLYDHFGRRDEKYLVDELDMFLSNIGIRGYSDGLRDNETNELLTREWGAGHWIEHEGAQGKYYDCSICDHSLMEIHKGMKFCPYCGAKMDNPL